MLEPHFADSLRVKLKLTVLDTPEKLAAQVRANLAADPALADYTMDFGHLEDARILTEQRGCNPGRWQDMPTVSPLLTQEQRFPRTKRGHASGQV